MSFEVVNYYTVWTRLCIDYFPCNTVRRFSRAWANTASSCKVWLCTCSRIRALDFPCLALRNVFSHRHLKTVCELESSQQAARSLFRWWSVISSSKSKNSPCSKHSRSVLERSSKLMIGIKILILQSNVWSLLSILVMVLRRRWMSQHPWNHGVI